LPHGLWSSVWFATSQARLAALPNTLTMIVLASNFGTFLLYMLSCIICIVAYQGHPNYKFTRHMAIPIFGLLANLACMAFYIIGPFMGYGTKMEPCGAVGIALVWAIYGGIYFTRASRAAGRTTFVMSREGRA
jgi:APA family basic amino acid/polyamine antiporter